MTTAEPTSVPEVTAEDLRATLAAGEPAKVLDIRPRDQFEAWHVPGSRHVGGYQALKAGHEDVFDDRAIPDDEPIITVCGAGRTSQEAARQLREQGREAYSLKGGMRAWSFAWNAAKRRFPAAEAEVVQLRRTGKGCLSYLVGSEGEALVIDPSLSPDIYEKQAANHSWSIIGVLDTHVHADHLSRAQRLADRTGAVLYLPSQERVSYTHEPLSDGDVLEVGGASLTALHTPGHTPESTSYWLDGAVFTGDTLFLQGVGRPDLDADPEQALRKARRLHQSLGRLNRLPDETIVLPGHASAPIPFDGEVVGRPIRSVKDDVEAFHLSEEEFVAQVTENVPETPPNHETMISANTSGEWPETGDLADLEAGANRCAVG